MLKRYNNNPILEPIAEHPWESKMVFNTGAIYIDNKIHLLYRASDEKEKSYLGYACSSDGFNIEERQKNPVLSPQSDIDCFGIEDPRMTEIEGRIFITYTSYGRIPDIDLEAFKRFKYGFKTYQIGLTSISVDDFMNKRWIFDEKVYPLKRVKDKNCVILPKKYDDKYIIYHRIAPHIWGCYSDDLINWYQHNIIMSPLQEWEGLKIGAGAPPIKTEKGWLFIYHGVSNHFVYHLGFVFLDLNDPFKITYRHPEPILKPEMKYELEGVIPSVVFTCGAILKDDTIFVYYGGADTVIGVATAPISEFYRLAGF